MSRISITKRFTFEAAHFLADKSFGKCERVHGHSYQLFVTVSAEKLENSMVMNFSDLSTIVKENIIDKVDHFLLNDVFPEVKFPTSENIVLKFVEILENKLPEGISLEKVKLSETSNSFVEWTK